MLEHLNNAEDSDFTIIHTKDLVKNKRYKVSDFFVMKTKYGNKVVASIEDPTGDGKYFLPPRYSVIIKRWADNLEDIDCNNLYMVLEGHRKDKYRSPILKFVVENENNEETNVENK